MEEAMENPTNNNTMYYLLGAVVLVAVIGAGFFMRPKAPAPAPAETGAPVTTPALGPISKLGCDTQYYNPVIGFPKYYLSVEGSDVPGATNVDCTMIISQENKVVATEKVSGPLVANTARGGNVFKCTTGGLDLKPTIPTKVDVSLLDDKGAKATCSAVFSLPK